MARKIYAKCYTVCDIERLLLRLSFEYSEDHLSCILGYHRNNAALKILSKILKRQQIKDDAGRNASYVNINIAECVLCLRVNYDDVPKMKFNIFSSIRE